MVKSNSLTVLNSSEKTNTTSIESQQTYGSTIYRYMVVPKPYLTRVQLEQTPEEVITSLRKALPSAHFDQMTNHDIKIFFEIEQLLTKDKLQKIAGSISRIKENKRMHFYYLTLKEPFARVCINLKRFDTVFRDVIYGSLPGICSYSVCVKAKYFRFQTTELLTKHHLRRLEKQLMKKIPVFQRIFRQNFKNIFKCLPPKAVARIHEVKTSIYSEYDKDVESDFLIKHIY